MENRQAELYDGEQRPHGQGSDVIPGSRESGYEPPEWGEIELRILDAAAELVAARGLEGLTVTALAKRAGVSRPTVYRRWPGTDEIVRATLLRTTLSLIERLGPLPGTREGLVDTVLRFSSLFRADPLYRSLLERQPELFTRYSLERIGSSQRALLQWIAAAIEASQHDESVRRGDAGEMSVMLLLIAQSAVLSHHSVSALIGEEELDAQLRVAIDGFLRP